MYNQQMQELYLLLRYLQHSNTNSCLIFLKYLASVFLLSARSISHIVTLLTVRTTPLNPINVQSYRVNVLVLFMMTNLQLDNVTVLLPLYLNDYSSKSIILRHFIFGILIRTCIIIT